MIKMIKFHMCENQYQMTCLHPPYFFFIDQSYHFLFISSLNKYMIYQLIMLYFYSCWTWKGASLQIAAYCTLIWKQWYCIQNINNTCSAIKAHSPPFLDYFFFTQRCVNEIPEDAVDRNCWLHFSSAQCPWPLKCPHFH